MASFPPIDMAVICPGPSPVESHGARRMLEQIARHDRSHDYPYCWGYTIFRTVYTLGSDERVAEAMKRLATTSKHFAEEESLEAPVRGRRERLVDSRLSEALAGRYYSELIEDEQSLDGLSERAVGERFDNWIRDCLRPIPGRVWQGNTRFHFCLMLDERSLTNILSLPKDIDEQKRQGRYQEDDDTCWVKVISNRLKTEDEDGSGERYWLRVGITSYLFPMWFLNTDGDIPIEEVGWIDAEDGVQNVWNSSTKDWFT